ncbi:MAG: hypothetical protein QNJ72_21955 [Pleurocapsa sp. MO_226.B13]|nr:hypothetical protein [Pleurocapsa sp. MO_226.B13]
MVLAYVRSEQDDPILVLLNMSEEKSLFRGDNFEPLSEGAPLEPLSRAGHSGTRSEFESQPLACPKGYPHSSRQGGIIRASRSAYVARQTAWKVLASTHSVATEKLPSLRVNLKPFEGLVLKSD